MLTVKITGTLFMAIAVVAVAFYFLGGVMKQLGELTGLMTLEDVGAGGIAVGLAVIGIFLFALILTVIDVGDR